MAGYKEDETVRQVKQILTFHGLYPYNIQRLNTGCFTAGNGSGKRFIRSAMKGTLDFEGFDRKGRFVGIECKREKGGKLSPEQAERIQYINRCGGVAVVVTSGVDCLRQLKEKGVLDGIV